MLICLIQKSLVCCFGNLLFNLIFRGHRKIMKIGFYFIISIQLIAKKLDFVVMFSLVYLIFDSYVSYLKIQLFILKKKKKEFFFSNYLWKSISKIHLRVLMVKNLFLKCMQPDFIWYAFSFLFSIKFQFWMVHESELMVPNKWDDSWLWRTY